MLLAFLLFLQTSVNLTMNKLVYGKKILYFLSIFHIFLFSYLTALGGNAITVLLEVVVLSGLAP